MAQLNISKEERDSIDTLLKQANDPALKPLLKKLQQLSFNTKTCTNCGTEYEATNPRKTTCSDACRQALSRSKRAKPIFSVGDQVQSRRDKSYSFTVTKVRWTAGCWFVTGADGTSSPERELKRVRSAAVAKHWTEAKAKDAAPQPKAKFKVGEKVCTGPKWSDDPLLQSTVKRRKWSNGSWCYQFGSRSFAWYGENTILGAPDRK